jgi:hypothetical protein
MTTKTNILILIILTFSSVYGQKPKVKKEIKITSTYSYINAKDGKRNTSKVGTITHDTITAEYHQKGIISYRSNNPNLTFSNSVYKQRDSLIFIRNDQNFKHQRAYWSDSTSIDIYTQIFTDSTVQTQLSQGDTIKIKKWFFQHGKLFKYYESEISPGYFGSMVEIIIYDIKTKDREVATVMTTSFPLRITDTSRIDNNLKTRVFIQSVYNKDKKEWFEKKKTQLKKREDIIWETFYRNYDKRYVTTKITKRYNKYGLLISEEKYDTYLKRIETKTTYEYEYY